MNQKKLKDQVADLRKQQALVANFERDLKLNILQVMAKHHEAFVGNGMLSHFNDFIESYYNMPLPEIEAMKAELHLRAQDIINNHPTRTQCRKLADAVKTAERKAFEIKELKNYLISVQN